MESISQVGNTFSVSLSMQNICLVVREGFNTTRMYTYSNKEILLTHTKWQLNDVQLKCIMVHEGMQKLKNGVCQGAMKNQVAVLGFPYQ